MPGPPPKPGAARRNRKATAADLPTEDEASAKAASKRRPALPNRGPGKAWHARTRTWWERVWSSPMADRYLRVHEDGILGLAELIDARNKLDAGNPYRLKLEAEIRMQRRDYGLTPADQLRLGWVIDDDTPEDHAKPRPKAAGSAADSDVDPRSVLRAVK